MTYGSKGPALPKETSGDSKNYPGSGKKTGPVELFPVKKAKKKLGGPPPVNV